MHDHFEESDGGYADVFKMVEVFLPWLCICNGLLLRLVVAIESVALRVNQLDGIFELCYR